MALASEGYCAIVYTQVVIEELRRQQRERLEKLQADAHHLTKTLFHEGESMQSITAQLDGALGSLESKNEADFEKLFSQAGVIREPVPVDATERLVGRDIGRRRPFLEVGDDRVSAGFRDAVIWESLLALVTAERGFDKVLFVTQDRGFLAKSGGLHQDLLDDLNSIAAGPDRVVVVKTVFEAVGRVRALIEATAEAADEALLTSTATDALLGLVDKSVSIEMVHGGEYDYPSFVQFATGPLEDATIDDIEQQTDFVFDRDGRGDTVTATAEARVYLSGFVFKSDWYADEDSVSIIEDWNDHYFHASNEVVVEAVVEIDVSGPTPEAISVELRDFVVDQSDDLSAPHEAPFTAGPETP